MSSPKVAIWATSWLAALIVETFAITAGRVPGPCTANAHGGIETTFALIDETSTPVTDRDVITTPSLIYFGYTYCPDMCPFDVARNADVVDILVQQGTTITPIFITVDPERDTPAQLQRYTDHFHPTMIGLTGPLADIQGVAKSYGAYFQKVGNDDADYLVDHSTLSYFVLPTIGFVELFQNDLSSETMAEQITCLIDRYGPQT